MVHHRLYRPDTDPWDYADDELVTLCENCHEEEYDCSNDASEVLRSATKSKLWSGNIYALAMSIHFMKTKFPIDVVISLVCWLLEDPSAQELLKEAYDRRMAALTERFEREILHASQNAGP